MNTRAKKETVVETNAVTEVVEQPKQQERRRERRSSFNGTRQKLSVNYQIPGYHLHIFNDTADGRIQQALDTGYEFVSPEEVGGASTNVISSNTDLGSKVRYLVGTNGSEPMYAYLMKIKQEWFEEDQAELQERNNRTDAAIRGGQMAIQKDKTNYYDAGIRMK